MDIINLSTKKIKIAVFIFITIIAIVGITFFLIGLLKPKFAGILIDSDPISTVYIDGQKVGHTPYKATRKPGEIVIRIIPDIYQTAPAPYDTKIDLNAGVEAVVRRQFGPTDDTSAGEVISFEKTSANETSLAVVTIPDSVQLTVDNLQKYSTPQKLSGVSPGKHSFILSLDGYQDKKLDVNLYQGYKLTAIVKLAKKKIETASMPSPTPQPNSEPVELVEISQTQTGFLRVRSEPSTLGNEVGRVVPGRKYKLVEVDQDTGWYKIEYDEDSDGWISNQFARKVATSSASQPKP